MEGEYLQSPHDRLFKQAFGRVESAAAFFKAYVPEELAVAIDWQSLTPAPGSFVDETLRHQESDLLFNVRLCGSVVQLYCLFEHQSTVDRQMPFRLLKYMVRIWEQTLRDGATEGGLAPILPVVLYHGRQGWEQSRHFTDMLAFPPEMELLRRYQPAFEHLLVDVGALGLDEIRGDIIGRMALQLMRAASRGELKDWLEKSGRLWIDLLRQGKPSGILEVFLRYLIAVDSDINYQTLERALENTGTEQLPKDVMSIAEELIEKGRQEGRQEGRLEGRQEGRQEGLDHGALIGRIQALEDLLGFPVTTVTELEQSSRRQLESRLEALKARLPKLS